jgi:hypothetical protein
MAFKQLYQLWEYQIIVAKVHAFPGMNWMEQKGPLLGSILQDVVTIHIQMLGS